MVRRRHIAVAAGPGLSALLDVDPAGTHPKENTVTDRPYTDADLRHEAASQHAALTEDPDFGSVGEGMQDAYVGSTLNGDDGHTWAELLPYEADGGEAYNAAQRKIHDLVSGADVSEWAVNLGADALEPDPRALDAGKSRVRIHFAFAPDISDDDRADLISQFAAFMTSGLT